ncbi:hypothetical protein J8273_4354 [Carpediemonas membranifera]|uniref:Uncharacterized protein n=1 Tax=Carpediemonas membranifera TaxID=201153 RepID=A0A8J6E4B7_9EUKA|nr:hypothetical protein J8273_4354 [Carpediemonas membranifera]|eukprot:KAG9394252.1 hypothetical protein J8273_4354 [Carpediemonas membranifera]
MVYKTFWTIDALGFFGGIVGLIGAFIMFSISIAALFKQKRLPEHYKKDFREVAPYGYLTMLALVQALSSLRQFLPDYLPVTRVIGVIYWEAADIELLGHTAVFVMFSVLHSIFNVQKRTVHFVVVAWLVFVHALAAAVVVLATPVTVFFGNPKRFFQDISWPGMAVFFPFYFIVLTVTIGFSLISLGHALSSCIKAKRNCLAGFLPVAFVLLSTLPFQLPLYWYRVVKALHCREAIITASPALFNSACGVIQGILTFCIFPTHRRIRRRKNRSEHLINPADSIWTSEASESEMSDSGQSNTATEALGGSEMDA